MVGEARAVASRAHWAAARAAPPISNRRTCPSPRPSTTADAVFVGRRGRHDLIPPTDALRQLYEWDSLLAFIAAVVDRGPVYRYADPLGAQHRRHEGRRQPAGHYDQTDFVTSIVLQDCQTGGDFECR
jgi:hypothetical protein